MYFFSFFVFSKFFLLDRLIHSCSYLFFHSLTCTDFTLYGLLFNTFQQYFVVLFLTLNLILIIVFVLMYHIDVSPQHSRSNSVYRKINSPSTITGQKLRAFYFNILTSFRNQHFVQTQEMFRVRSKQPQTPSNYYQTTHLQMPENSPYNCKRN